jgi:hypothetical protein
VKKGNISEADFIELIKSSKVAHLNNLDGLAKKPDKKKHKFKAIPVERDGIKFDSTKEANRYLELKFMEKHGQITDLKLQVPFELNEGGSHPVKYIADFTYNDQDGAYVVEDSKGFKTREYLKKKRLMVKMWGVKVKET